MLDAGVYLAPSQFESAFVSLSHGEAETAATLEAFRAAMTSV
jgi:glutamate-1-semialdehyde 2,1-aminomutase